jgi:NIMA-interacting peptidyl-prolyl cis-trans isomerase 1
LRIYLAQISGGADTFGALAQQHSDCPSHKNAGDLGWFGPGQMQKPFESATYGLDVGQISDVVETDSGVHLIMRTG